MKEPLFYNFQVGVVVIIAVLLLPITLPLAVAIESVIFLRNYFKNVL